MVSRLKDCTQLEVFRDLETLPDRGRSGYSRAWRAIQEKMEDSLVLGAKGLVRIDITHLLPDFPGMFARLCTMRSLEYMKIVIAREKRYESSPASEVNAARDATLVRRATGANYGHTAKDLELEGDIEDLATALELFPPNSNSASPLSTTPSSRYARVESLCLAYYLPNEPPLSSVTRIFDLLPSDFIPATLKSLSLELLDNAKEIADMLPEAGEFILDMSVVAGSFRQFDCLVKLCIAVPFDVKVTIAYLGRLADGGMKQTLKHLTIMASLERADEEEGEDRHGGELLKPLQLVDVAGTLFPHLLVLGLELDAWTELPLEPTIVPATSRPPLQQLNVGYSMILESNVQRIAELFQRSFPNLKQMFSVGGEESGQKSLWEEVSKRSGCKAAPVIIDLGL